MMWSEVLDHTMIEDDPIYHAIYNVLERIYTEHDTITKGEIYDVMNKIYVEIHSRDVVQHSNHIKEISIKNKEIVMLNKKFKKLEKEVADLKNKLAVKDYQLKQCNYVACEYEKRLQAHMGVDDFYEYMRDVMHQLIVKDIDFHDPELWDEDDDLDEIVEDMKNVGSDNGCNADN